MTNMIEGVYIQMLKPCLVLAERHTIEILNGQMDVRNVKLFVARAGSSAGGHSHPYVEGKYVISGRIAYALRSANGSMSCELVAGHLMILAPGIIHTAEFLEDTTIVDFSSVGFLSSLFNNQAA